jgi:hypothetical protein
MSRFAGSFRLSPIRLAGVLVALTLMLVGASQAMATARYAVPGGDASDPNCFAKTSNCSGQHALDVALTGDEVIFATGTYDTGSAGLTQNSNPGQDVHGEDGQPPPRIIATNGGWTFFACFCSNNDGSFSHMTFENHGTGGALFVVGGGAGHAVTVDNIQGVGATNTLLVYVLDTVVTNTSAFANAGNGVGIYSLANATYRGVTSIAPASGGIAFQQGPNGSTDLGIVRNAILSGGSGGADVKTLNSGSTFGNVDIDFSNYANVSNCSGCTLTQGSNSQAIPPALVDRANGNFHETIDSPTIDSGEDSANNGNFDVDGDPRKVGPAPDIGADEFVPGQAPPAVNTVAPPPGTALAGSNPLTQAFPGLRLSRVTFKASGNKTITVPIACPAFVTGNCVGSIAFKTASKVVVPKKANAAAKKKRVTLGKASFSIPKGTTKNVKVKLSKAAQKLLAAKGKIKAKDTLTVTANGVKKTTSQNVTIKGKKKK